MSSFLHLITGQTRLENFNQKLMAKITERDTMRIIADLPKPTYEALAQAAEKHGITVMEMATKILQLVLSQPAPDVEN